MKQFIKHAGIFGLSILLTIIVFNYNFDLYHVFHNDLESINRYPQLIDYINHHHFKISYMLEHNKDYDSVIMGSSRVGFIDAGKIKQGKYLNMWVPSSVPYLIGLDLKYLVKHGCNIKNVILGLDDVSYSISLASYEHGPRQFRHFPYTMREKIQFYLLHLLILPSSHYIKFKLNLYKDSEILAKAYLKENGMFLWPDMEDYINNNPEEHIKLKKFEKVQTTFFQCNRLKETLSELRDIKEFCDSHNINLIIIFNPLHNKTFLFRNKKGFEEYLTFKREVASFSPFYDFTGINSVTTNNLNFYETSHSRPHVGDMIISRIFNQKLVDVPNDFGLYITKENIDKHLEFQLKQYVQYKTKKEKPEDSNPK